MFKKVQVAVICIAVACFIGAVFSYAGLSTLLATSFSLTITTILWNFLLSHRATTKVAPAERDQQLAQAPPAGSALVYVSRELKLAGGAIGVGYVSASVLLAQKLGATRLIILVVAGQIIASVVFDHFGLIGYSVRPMSVWRGFGCLLLVAAVVIIKSN